MPARAFHSGTVFKAHGTSGARNQLAGFVANRKSKIANLELVASQYANHDALDSASVGIDDAGRVRRMKIDMSFNSPAGGAFTMSMTEDLFAFGTKVRVRPPAAGQVLDLACPGFFVASSLIG